MPTSSYCFHCQLPVEKSGQYSLSEQGDTLEFCCPGCRAVAQTILNSGLGKFYEYREGTTEPAAENAAELQFDLYDRAEFQRDFVFGNDVQKTALISIKGISCAACTWLIEHSLEHIDGVERVHVNLAQHRASVSYREDTVTPSTLFKNIQSIGYTPQPWSADREQRLLEQEQHLALRRLGVAGIGMMQVGMYAIALHAGAIQGMAEHYRDFLRLVSLLVATAVVFYSARPFFEAAWRNVRNRSLGMDVPVSIAIGLAYGASCWASFRGGTEVYFDSVAMFTFFLLASRYLEMRARYRNQSLSRGLAQIQAQYAWRFSENESTVVQTPIGTIEVGDKLMVKAGEVIPADATVVEGHSSIDQSIISGEFLPIPVKPGDTVTAGSINADGVLGIKVTAIAANTRLALITRLLERAQADKPRAAMLADRLAGVFVGVVLCCAALAGLYWWQLQPEQALGIALSVLVVSCPCALSLATPATLTSALSALKRRGIVLSRSVMLDQLPKATLFAFDKTGTLTSGELKLRDTRVLAELPPERCIAIASALENYSNHPIARAFQARDRNVQAREPEVVTGHGISASIDGQRYRLGSASFVGHGSPSPETDCELADSHCVRVYLANEQQLLACFELDDPLRKSAIPALAELQRRGFKTALLSGDASPAVAAVARATGIEEYYGGTDPETKLAHIQRWQQEGHCVVMVGDGINDVPVLGAADISIAMVDATELAKASADCLFLADDLGRLEVLLNTASATGRVIMQNLGWALLYNTVGIPLAAAGFVAPWLAALGMSCSSLVVVGNALRLSRTSGH